MHTPHDEFWDVNTPMRTVNIVRNASAMSVCCCGRSDNKFDVDSPNECTHFSRIQFATRTTHFGLSMRESELPKSIRKSARLRSAPQSQNQTRDSLRKYNDARRGYNLQDCAGRSGSDTSTAALSTRRSTGWTLNTYTAPLTVH
jgi:hypothetical protein